MHSIVYSLVRAKGRVMISDSCSSSASETAESSILINSVARLLFYMFFVLENKSSV